MTAYAASYDAYKRVDVETASQGKLIVMLFNGAIQRAEEGRRAIVEGKMQSVHDNLIRAQDILAELRSSLDMNVGDIATNLDRIYEYLQHLLIQANIKKDCNPIVECINHLTGLRDTWKEAFALAAKGGDHVAAPSISQHGASVMNLQG